MWDGAAILNCHNKSAHGNGGAICLAGAALTDLGDNLFENNSAENHGGAVSVSYVKNDDNTTTATSCATAR